jgi:putative heme-binding domain-containing protein
LRDKDVDYFLKNILDPNAVVEPRFVAYNVELKDERSMLGIIKTENASGLTLVMGGGQTETLARADVKEIRASSLSLMPAGLEEAIAPVEMADLIAYLKAGAGEAEASPGADTVLRDPVSVARFLLDESQPANLRENAIKANPQFAAALIAEMARELAPGTEEYRRIPWIWRVAIAAAKRNDAEQLKRVLDVSLPGENEPLRDWQAVVIGGGVINGISQRGQYPGRRILEIIGNDEPLQKRWTRALDLSAAMADNEKVPPGTRYDALRMLGVEPWEKRGAQLVRYLGHKNGELQMGAVSGLADMESIEATKALREALPKLTGGNRKLVEEALARRK